MMELIVERVKIFKFRSVHITDNLKWSIHTDIVVKKGRRGWRNLAWPLRPSQTSTNAPLRASCRSVSPPGCNCTVCNRRALQKVLQSAQHITGGTLPSLQDIYSTRCHRKGKKIIKDLSHPSHSLFTPLPAKRQRVYRCIKAGTERLKNSF